MPVIASPQPPQTSPPLSIVGCPPGALGCPFSLSCHLHWSGPHLSPSCLNRSEVFPAVPTPTLAPGTSLFTQQPRCSLRIVNAIMSAPVMLRTTPPPLAHGTLPAPPASSLILYPTSPRSARACLSPVPADAEGRLRHPGGMTPSQYGGGSLFSHVQQTYERDPNAGGQEGLCISTGAAGDGAVQESCVISPKPMRLAKTHSHTFIK